MTTEELLSTLRVPEWKVQDATKITTFIRCPRMYFYEYVLGWRSDSPNNHLVFGSAVHKAMEHLYLNGFDNNEIIRAHEKFLKVYREEFPEDTDDLFHPKTPENFLVVLAAYVHKYPRDLENFEVMYTEIAGEVSLTDEIVVAFRMDTILKELRTGKFSSLEHKTGSSLWNWEMQWDLATQIGLYTHVLYCMHDPDMVDGVRMNGMIFHKVKKAWEKLQTAQPLGNLNPPFSFIRYPAFKSPVQMQTWLWNTIFYIDQIKFNFDLLSRCREDDPVMYAFPLRHTACTDFGGCEWHDFCLSFQNPLSRCMQVPVGYRVEHWNPLKEEASHHFDLKGGDK